MAPKKIVSKNPKAAKYLVRSENGEILGKSRKRNREIEPWSRVPGYKSQY